MPSFSQMTQAGANDPLGGLGARKPRPEEIAKRDAEITAKQAAERRAHDFEKIVHATEKQMRDDLLKPPLGNARSAPLGKDAAKMWLTQNGYLVQAIAAEAMSQEIPDWWKVADRLDGFNPTGTATGRLSSSAPTATEVQKPAADRIWPDDFKREIADEGCDLLGVFNNHFGVNFGPESLLSIARTNKMGPREFLTEMSHRETLGMKVWFDLPPGCKAFLRKVTAS